MLLDILINGLILGVIAGIVATVYVNVLSKEEHFAWWWQFGNRFEHEWFFKPIWGCHKCFSGQFCLLVYLFHTLSIEKTFAMLGFMPVLALQIDFEGYSLIEHIFSISSGILFSIVFTKILNIVK